MIVLLSVIEEKQKPLQGMDYIMYECYHLLRVRSKLQFILTFLNIYILLQIYSRLKVT